MRIGNIDFVGYPLFLAPMEDVTDPSFRYMCKQFGADMVYTEFVSSDGLIRDAGKSMLKLKISEEERPVGVQIYGHLMEPMIEAAKIAAQVKPDVIDINFGCPVKKIANRGAGSGMMKEPDKMVEMTRRIVDSVKIPVTVKTRLGWDENSLIICELAERLQDAGIAALTIHGRTRSQLYKGEADWTLIGKVKNNSRMKIPVIGNGDINSPEIAKQRFDNYGIDAIMIGRSTYGCPWIFRNIRHYLEKGELLPEPDVNERVQIAKTHFIKSIEVKGEKVGVLEMRRHLSSYFKGLPDFKETRLKLVTENNPDTVLRLLDYVKERWGN
ncbi:MAG: tRNA dihydrouridine synthase DusB [Prevotellaceae bacterium]|jgi:nifR3 family TIM-barrel protein|nr:tRNA dihydrouridine synthase DusB [Prevotellaceae bacterium]